ncbi:hypothetical protein SprV_0401483600 [Sparganum proliferum]
MARTYQYDRRWLRAQGPTKINSPPCDRSWLRYLKITCLVKVTESLRLAFTNSPCPCPARECCRDNSPNHPQLCADWDAAMVPGEVLQSAVDMADFGDLTCCDLVTDLCVSWDRSPKVGEPLDSCEATSTGIDSQLGVVSIWRRLFQDQCLVRDDGQARSDQP